MKTIFKVYTPEKVILITDDPVKAAKVLESYEVADQQAGVFEKGYYRLSYFDDKD